MLYYNLTVNWHYAILARGGLPVLQTYPSKYLFITQHLFIMHS